MGLREDALQLHREKRGKVAVVSKVTMRDARDLSLAYSPGVAEPCKEIAENTDDVFTYTNRGNLVAVVSDGTAVLGLGDIGPYAAMPVMEGKAILFKNFADVDAFPLCVDTKVVDEVVETVIRIAPTFGGVNLEDISGPRCFEIEEKIKAKLDIPVFHDDQHGTAVVCFAALINALKVAGKSLSDVKIVINGAGAAGHSITNLLWTAGARHFRICDTKGILAPGHNGNNRYKEELAQLTNPEGETGDLTKAMQGADVFIGVSAADVVTPKMVRSMAKNALVFGLANPVPEIMPDKAVEAGALVVATGRSDFANQVNNVLGFPGIFRGALDVRAREITMGMKVAAANAIASLVEPEKLSKDYVIPNPFDRRVVPAVAFAVAQAAMAEGVAKSPVDLASYLQDLKARFSEA